MSKLVGTGVQASRMSRAIQQTESQQPVVQSSPPANPTGWTEWVDPISGEKRIFNPSSRTWELQLADAINWSHDISFSATDRDTVAWTNTGHIYSDTTYNITTAGNTGNMTDGVLYYVYFDADVSTTALQVTTTPSSAVGVNKILLGVCKSSTALSGQEAEFKMFGGDGQLITASHLASNSVTTDKLVANSVIASKISVAQLSAIAADMGAITAGTITLSASGHIKAGQTAYDTGTGFWLGIDGATPKFSMGTTNQKVTWDGTNLGILGDIKTTVAYVAGEDLVAGRFVRIRATDGLVYYAGNDLGTGFAAYDTFANRIGIVKNSCSTGQTVYVQVTGIYIGSGYSIKGYYLAPSTNVYFHDGAGNVGSHIYGSFKAGLVFNSGAHTKIDWGRLYGFGISGSPTGSVTVELYAVDGSNLPTGAPLCSDSSLTAAGITGSNYFQFNDYAPVTLTPSTNYALVWSFTGGGVGDYIYGQYTTETSLGYLYYDGMSWSIDTTKKYGGLIKKNTGELENVLMSNNRVGLAVSSTNLLLIQS